MLFGIGYYFSIERHLVHLPSLANCYEMQRLGMGWVKQALQKEMKIRKKCLSTSLLQTFVSLFVSSRWCHLMFFVEWQ